MPVLGTVNTPVVPIISVALIGFTNVHDVLGGGPTRAVDDVNLQSVLSFHVHVFQIPIELIGLLRIARVVDVLVVAV